MSFIVRAKLGRWKSRRLEATSLKASSSSSSPTSINQWQQHHACKRGGATCDAMNVTDVRQKVCHEQRDRKIDIFSRISDFEQRNGFFLIFPVEKFRLHCNGVSSLVSAVLPTMTPRKSNDDNSSNMNDAATSEFNRSPVLIRAVSSQYPSSSWMRAAGWFLAFVIPSLFYIGPCMLIVPPVLYYMVSMKAALVLLIVNLALMTLPTKPWRRFRGIFELWYDLFDFHHNLSLGHNNMGPAHLTKKESSSLLICAMHPHGVIPIQAFLWMAFCNQYLPASYGVGAAADVVMRIPLLRQILGWGSAGSASRHVLKEHLEKGNNLFILPGGVAEFSPPSQKHTSSWQLDVAS